MKNDNGNMRWIVIILAIFLLFSMKGSLPKLAVDDISGQSCSESADCPCLGTYNYTTALSAPANEAVGIGVGQCINQQCDMTYCVDVKDVGLWVRDHPWDYLRSNPATLFALVGMVALGLLWPKY